MTAPAPCSRRTFLERCVLASATGRVLPVLGASALGGCASVATRVLPMTNGQVHVRLREHPELHEEHGVLRVTPEGSTDSFFVVRTSADVPIALSSVCTHLGCAVELVTGQLVCPCHGSTYALDGTVRRGPAVKPLPRYTARLEPDDVLVIDLGKSA
ncbi:MAG: ubiquinol-cytochrome c reductase iron-sulfur subunit [Gemmatimonadetes bacterium]|nr:ubiquinol-cytochrome c reductase iron-sulfur subunit [Gemmatimonadota bacterium]